MCLALQNLEGHVCVCACNALWVPFMLRVTSTDSAPGQRQLRRVRTWDAGRPRLSASARASAQKLPTGGRRSPIGLRVRICSRCP